MSEHTAVVINPDGIIRMIRFYLKHKGSAQSLPVETKKKPKPQYIWPPVSNTDEKVVQVKNQQH